MNKKQELLGMPYGTASYRLVKSILFSLVQESGRNVCFRCSKKIESINEFSVDHKESWQSAPDPIQSFFDVDNISFSHKKCNYGAASRPNKRFLNEKERFKFHSSHPDGWTKRNRLSKKNGKTNPTLERY